MDVDDSRLTGSYILPGVVVPPGVSIGYGSVIGYPSIDLPEDQDSCPTMIGTCTRIGCHCVVEAGASIGAHVKVDHYVRIGPGSVIGDYTRMLYGARVHCDVRIGKRCRIGGNCPDRAVFEDDVTHFGRLAHEYNLPSGDWDKHEEPSPIIGARSIIAAGALVIGGVRIGRNVFVAAGEIVRNDIPDRSVVYKGQVIPGDSWHGQLSVHGFFDWMGGE